MKVLNWDRKEKKKKIDKENKVVTATETWEDRNYQTFRTVF